MSVQLASKFQRLTARAIDSVIMVGMYWLLEALDAAPPAFYSWLVTGDTLEVTLSWGSIRDAVTAPFIALAIWLVFEAVPTASHGRTIGKLLIGIKVLRADTWAEPGIGKSAGRWAVPAALFLVPGVGMLLAALAYASAAWNRHGQGWHDKAAGTVVVRSRLGLYTVPRQSAADEQAHPVPSSEDSTVDMSAVQAAPRVPAPALQTGYATLGTGGRVELASPGRRLAARALDWALGGTAFLAVAVLLAETIDRSDPVQEFYDGIWYGLTRGLLVVLGLGAVYEIAMIASRGQTMGKSRAGVRVVRADDGTDPGAARSALRWLAVAMPRLPAVLVLMGAATWSGGTAVAAMLTALALWSIVYVSLLWGRDHKGWHDKVAGTLVVREPAAGPHRRGSRRPE